jgi:hypothetical protein
MRNEIMEGGGGLNGDIYRMKGTREETGMVMISDPDKEFHFMDWGDATDKELSSWMFILDDNVGLSCLTSVVTLSGDTLSNGIIYNKPDPNRNFGSDVRVSRCYNMFMTIQGIGSELAIYPYDGLCGVSGCTLYSENGYTLGYGMGGYEFVDSVLVNLSNVTSATDFVTFYNNVIDKSQEYVGNNFSIYTGMSADNQFSWTPPEDYPFTHTNSMYGATINDIINNDSYLNQLLPFAGIESPPNPGRNTPNNTGYENGIFGSDRLY